MEIVLNKKFLNKLLIVGLVLSHFIVDQVSKFMATSYLIGKGTVRVIGDLFILRYAQNSGAFLSFGSDFPEPIKVILLWILPLILLVVFFVYVLTRDNMSKGELIAVTAIIGGGLSNIIDRLRLGGLVTDFLNFGIGNLRTGILNIADLSITFGAIFLIIIYINNERNLKKTVTTENPDTHTEL